MLWRIKQAWGYDIDSWSLESVCSNYILSYCQQWQIHTHLSQLKYVVDKQAWSSCIKQIMMYSLPHQKFDQSPVKKSIQAARVLPSEDLFFSRWSSYSRSSYICRFLKCHHLTVPLLTLRSHRNLILFSEGRSRSVCWPTYVSLPTAPETSLSDQIKEYPIKEKIQDPIAASESQNKEYYKDPITGRPCERIHTYVRVLDFDAIWEENGLRILHCWRFFLQIFEVMYSIEAFNLLVYHDFIPSPRAKQQLKHSVWYSREKISYELFMEHLNRECKGAMGFLGSNIDSVTRIGRSLRGLMKITDTG